jgi:hypothetical protein
MGLHSHSSLDEVVLYGNGLAILNETLHITSDCIPGHLDGLLYCFSVCDTSRKRRDQHSITSFRFPSKGDSVTEGPHNCINNR